MKKKVKMRIGIELNSVIRDINFQMVKYYKKDIVKDFDDENVNYNVTNIFDSLSFPNSEDKFNFLYEDYPFEIFGCAKTMHRNLAVTINNWLYDLTNEDDKYEVSCFSLKEEGLSIQSSYYFLSKCGIRIRETHFPTDGLQMWDNCDVLITCDERILKNKPQGKIVILVRKDDNKHLEKYADLVVDSLYDLLTTKDWYKNLKSKENTSWFSKLKNKFF